MDVDPTAAVIWAFVGGAAGMFAAFIVGAAALSALRRDWPFAAGRLLWSLPFLALTAYAARTILLAMGWIY